MVKGRMQVNAETNSTRVTRKKGDKKEHQTQGAVPIERRKRKESGRTRCFFFFSLWKTRTGKSGVTIPLRSRTRFFHPCRLRRKEEVHCHVSPLASTRRGWRRRTAAAHAGQSSLHTRLHIAAAIGRAGATAAGARRVAFAQGGREGRIGGRGRGWWSKRLQWLRRRRQKRCVQRDIRRVVRPWCPCQAGAVAAYA